MKATTTIIIILLGMLSVISCNKEKIEEHTVVVVQPKQVAPLVNDFRFLPQDRKPSLELKATVLSTTQVLLTWRKQGRQDYPIYVDNQLVSTCQCGSYTATVFPGTHQFKVAGSNTVTLSTYVEPDDPDDPPTPNAKYLKIEFNGARVSEISSWLNIRGMDMPGSGLDQPTKDSVLKWVKEYYKDQPVYVVNSGFADQTVVLTTYWEWFGAVGGVAFIESFGTGEYAFVFTSLLNYGKKEVILATAHEAGHTLGLYHAIDFCGQSYSQGPNIMGAGYYPWEPWEHTFSTNQLSNYQNGVCMYMNQVQIIYNTLTK